MAKKKPVPLPAIVEIRDAALSELRKAAAPLTAKQLCELISTVVKIPETVVLRILDECVTSGLLHPFSPATARGKPRYWDRDLVDWGCLQIENAIHKKGPQPIAKLKSAAKGLSNIQFQQAFQNLMDAGRVREHPPVGKSRTAKYGTEPPECEPYLADVSKSLSKIVRQLIEAGVCRDSLAKTIWVRLNEMGLSLPGNLTSPDATTVSSERQIDLIQLMRQIEPGAERGALVMCRELRRAAKLAKLQFDQLILELARDGRLMLHRHDHASGLGPLERDELVTDGVGTYYVGMALRRDEG